MTNRLSGIKVLSIEAKDLYAASQIQGMKGGYNIRDKDGNIKLKKFINTLDDSLCSRELRSAYEKATKRKDFSFFVNGKEYSTVVINVKFGLSFKEFNTCGKNLYLRPGYNLHNRKIEDGVCVEDGKLIAIKTNVPVNNPLPPCILGKYFSFEGGVYARAKTIRAIMNLTDLRRWAYTQGFVCDGNYYERWLRSAGSSRVGNCLFALSSVIKRMNDWATLGMNIRDGDEIDLASFESYLPLAASSIIGTVSIPPESILVVDEYESVFKDEVIAVEAIGGELATTKKIATIKNNIWDGQSLICESLFENYSDKSVMVLRNKFFKTCGLRTNIQQFFADHNITSVSQLSGFTLAQSVSQIKMITTESSIKARKFLDKEDWLANLSSTFGVVKTDKKTKYFNGRYVSSHYQMINTLELDLDDVNSLLKPSLDYLRAIRIDPDILRYHIHFELKDPSEAFEDAPDDIKNDIVFKLLGLTSRFSQTQMYKDFKKKIVKSFVRDLKKGHILVPGTYATLFGNPLEMLYCAIGKFNGIGLIEPRHIHCTKFKDGETLLGVRSPHIVAGNHLVTTNKRCEEIDNYFFLTPEVACVNTINENLLSRLNGADFDGDSILLTNQPLLVESARKNYNRFLVPTNFVESSKIKRTYTDEQKVDLDAKTSTNLIGSIVNTSQYLNSIYWSRLKGGESYEDLENLYEDVAALGVLSGVEIDRAKKECLLSSQKELDRLNAKYLITKDGKRIRPWFFQTITTENGYKIDHDKMLFEPFDCPMDYLHIIVDAESSRQAREYKTKTIPLMEIIKKPSRERMSGENLKQRDKVLRLVKESQDDITKLYVGYDSKSKQEKYVISVQAGEKIQSCAEQISKIAFTEYSMYITLKEIEKPENKKIAKLLFEVLFQQGNETFYKMLKESAEPLHQLKEVSGGDINLYSLTFKKEIFDTKKSDFL